jgi:hypothetical protein
MDDRFNSLAPLPLPGTLDILSAVLSIPSVAENLTAGELVRLFGGFRNASAAMKLGDKLAFYLAWERGATLKQLGDPIGKGYTKSAASRRNIMRRPVSGFPEGSHQLVEHIRAKFAQAGGDLAALDLMQAGAAAAPERNDVAAPKLE